MNSSQTRSFCKQNSYINTKPVNLFIPRLLPNLTTQYVCNYFVKNKIGVVTHIKSINRINEKNNKYWFAFLSVHFLDTTNGREMYEKIVKKEENVNMTYNDYEGKYWEISVRHQDRKRPSITSANTSVITPTPKQLEDGEIDEANILDSVFTIYDHIEIYKDYMEIEKEIYGSNNAHNYAFTSTWGEFIPLRV
jgi:hypothetical protein